MCSMCFAELGRMCVCVCVCLRYWSWNPTNCVKIDNKFIIVQRNNKYFHSKKKKCKSKKQKTNIEVSITSHNTSIIVELSHKYLYHHAFCMFLKKRKSCLLLCWRILTGKTQKVCNSTSYCVSESLLIEKACSTSSIRSFEA